MSEFQGRRKTSHRVRIAWELSEEMMDDGRPFVVGRDYTVSLNSRSMLRHHLELWRGRAFTEEELEGFDISKLIGQPAMLTVVHAKRDDGSISAKVEAVTKLPKGSKAPALVNGTQLYRVEDGRNSVYESLPEWLRRRIDQQVIQQETAPQSSDTKPGDPEDDVPF